VLLVYDERCDKAALPSGMHYNQTGGTCAVFFF